MTFLLLKKLQMALRFNIECINMKYFGYPCGTKLKLACMLLFEIRLTIFDKKRDGSLYRTNWNLTYFASDFFFFVSLLREIITLPYLFFS